MKILVSRFFKNLVKFFILCSANFVLNFGKIFAKQSNFRWNFCNFVKFVNKIHESLTNIFYQTIFYSFRKKLLNNFDFCQSFANFFRISWNFREIFFFLAKTFASTNNFGGSDSNKITLVIKWLKCELEFYRFLVLNVQ